MHEPSYGLMQRLRDDHFAEAVKVLDVGSRDVMGPGNPDQGSYRGLFGDGYVGLDIEHGKNVDVVIDPNETGRWKEIEASSFDAAICGQALEHCDRPWHVVEQMARALKPKGVVAIIAPWVWEAHLVDYYRFSDNGLVALVENAGLDVVKSGQNAWPTQFLSQVIVRVDAYAVGRKT